MAAAAAREGKAYVLYFFSGESLTRLFVEGWSLSLVMMEGRREEMHPEKTDFIGSSLNEILVQSLHRFPVH